jgi:hypothetical protein
MFSSQGKEAVGAVVRRMMRNDVTVASLVIRRYYKNLSLSLLHSFDLGNCLRTSGKG